MYFPQVRVKIVGCNVFCGAPISSWGERYEILTAVGVPACSPSDYLRNKFLMCITIYDSGTGL